MGLYLKKRKKLLKKFLVGLFLFVAGTVASLLFNALLRLFPNLHLTHPAFSVFIMTLVCVLAFKPLDSLCTHFFRDYLFRKKSYAHMALMDLAEELCLVLDLQELSNLIVNTFGEVLHLKTVALMTPRRSGKGYEIASTYGWTLAEAKKVRLEQDSMLVQIMTHQGGPHVLYKGGVDKALSWQQASRMAHDFDSLRSHWMIPFFVKEQFIGLLGFSAVDPETFFDESDYHFFREFGRALSKSLYNALSVTELKTAYHELQDVQSQLLQSTKLHAIEQLATGLAHEIHNPLTIISGKAQVLLLQKERNPLDEKVEDVLKTIVKQTKRAADITRKLLMFSQNTGSVKEKLPLDQVLEDTLSLIAYQTSLDGIEISKTMPVSLPPVYGNIHEMREVFLNLIQNAVQSVGSAGKIHCELRDHAQDQVIEFRILDSGPGIPPENLEKLFNPFFTTRPEATGLGLFVTKQIVHRYGGSIRVESNPKEGTLFVVQIPYRPAALAPGKSEEENKNYETHAYRR